MTLDKKTVLQDGQAWMLVDPHGNELFSVRKTPTAPGVQGRVDVRICAGKDANGNVILNEDGVTVAEPPIVSYIGTSDDNYADNTFDGVNFDHDSTGGMNFKLPGGVPGTGNFAFFGQNGRTPMVGIGSPDFAQALWLAYTVGASITSTSGPITMDPLPTS